MPFISNFRSPLRLILTVIMILTAFAVFTPAEANVSSLTVHRRSCGSLTAYAVYDSFSEGQGPFFAGFTADLNGNGIYGEAGEPTSYVRVLTGGGQAVKINTTLRFAPAAEGSTISVTVYEVDAVGTYISAPVAAVSYQCAHRPATDPLPSNANNAPQIAITARVAAGAVQVYSGASVKSTLLGGLPRGARVTVTAINQRGDWIQINFKGQTAWFMWKNKAVLIGPFSLLQVLPNFEG
jgi:hypothetical protein